VLGWSIGGVVAFELGQRLGDIGVDVRAVALIDTNYPGEYRHLWSNRWWKYKSILRPGLFRAAIDEFSVAIERRVKSAVAQVGRRLLVIAGEPLPRVESTTASGVPVTALDHSPAMTTVPVVLYAANTTNRARTEHRWRTVAPDMRVVPIIGRHRGIDSVMGVGRVHQIVDDLAVTVLAPGGSS